MPSADHSSRTLPVIDLSSYLDASPNNDALPAAQARTAAAIHEACLHYGFFYITGLDSVVSADEMDQVLAEARAFFQRPEEEKERIRIKKGDGARGWQRLRENTTQNAADHHEGLDLYRPVDHEDPTKLLHGPNQWPEQPSSFRSTLERWIDKMQVIGRALMRATAQGLGIDLESDEWRELEVKDSFWVLRGVVGGGYYGCYTLLHADSTLGALQVFLPAPAGSDTSSDGTQGDWLNADPIPGAFVVNIGEMWQVWTNGLYRATLHRVIHKGDNYRVSIPFFYEPSFDAVVRPLPTAVKLQRELDLSKDSKAPSRQAQDQVVYGEFLAKKVAGNFA